MLCLQGFHRIRVSWWKVVGDGVNSGVAYRNGSGRRKKNDSRGERYWVSGALRGLSHINPLK